MSAARWINERLLKGQSVSLPPGVFHIDSSLFVPAGRTATIAGAGRDLTRLAIADGAAFGVRSLGTLVLEDLTVDGSMQHKQAMVSGGNMTLRRCRVLGGFVDCVYSETPNALEVDDLRIGAMPWTGPGNGYGLHVKGPTSAGTRTIGGVQPHDMGMRHLITLEDRVDNVSVTNCSTPSGANFATLDLHGKNEGKASAGSITATNCVGRFNVGNDTFTNGSHLTLENCDLDGRKVHLYRNSLVRRRNVAGWQLDDNSAGTGSVQDF